MKNLIPLFWATIILCLGASCKKSTESPNDTTSQMELIDARDLDPADIAAYDREESKPFQGMSLKDCKLDAITKANDTLPLKDVLKNDILYVRYSQYACGDCINFLNSAIKEYGISNPTSKIRFLIKDIEMRDLHVFDIKMDKRFEIFKVDSLPTDFDEAHTPYVFKLDRNMRVFDYYIPRKELPDSLQTYLYK